MKERYPTYKLRPITDSLISAQHAIEAMVVQGEEEDIFDYRTDKPELYKLYMNINEIIGEVFEMYDN